jgi:hypothetical protein
MPLFEKRAMSPPLRPDQRRFRALLASIIAGVLGGAALLPVPAPGFSGPPVCVFKGISGLPCALCGGTRATQALLHGDLCRALYLNMAALPLVIVLVAAAMLAGYEAWRGRAATDWNRVLRKFRPALPMMVALLCLYWLVHLIGAVRQSKTELIDLRHPVAEAIHKRLAAQAR